MLKIRHGHIKLRGGHLPIHSSQKKQIELEDYEDAGGRLVQHTPHPPLRHMSSIKKMEHVREVVKDVPVLKKKKRTYISF